MVIIMAQKLERFYPQAGKFAILRHSLARFIITTMKQERRSGSSLQRHYAQPAPQARVNAVKDLTDLDVRDRENSGQGEGPCPRLVVAILIDPGLAQWSVTYPIGLRDTSLPNESRLRVLKENGKHLK